MLSFFIASMHFCIVNGEGTYQDSSRLQIQVPSHLFKPGGYSHRGAMFGNPPYGATIMQPMYYADSDLCDAVSLDKRTGYPTRPKDDSGKMEPWKSPYILMVDRGGCSFVEKVRNAQHAGAAGAIIADNMCTCDDDECMKSLNPDDVCEDIEPTMSDDGSGGDIKIPSFLMYKHDADAIKEAVMKDNQFIQMEMSWTMPRASDQVDYEIWTSPGDMISNEFFKQWKPVASRLGSSTVFTPRQYIINGEAACVDDYGTNLCTDMCTNNGKYCGISLEAEETSFGKTIKGTDRVVESLRRICIWQEYGVATEVGKIYWDYITEFSIKCDELGFFSSKQCVADVYKITGIKEDIIDNCMSNSGGTMPGERGKQQNIFLDKEIASEEENGIIVIPTLLVNSSHLNGVLSVINVFHAICAGFLEENKPEICRICEDCPNELSCLEDGICVSPNNNGGGISKRAFGLTLLLLCTSFGAIVFIQWKKSREEMRDHVRIILAEYMPLSGGDNEEGSTPMDFAEPKSNLLLD